MTRKIAQGLIAGMRQSVRPGVLKLRDFVHDRPAARKLMAQVKSIESLVAGGSHPLHAAYSSTQNYLSVFSNWLHRCGSSKISSAWSAMPRKPTCRAGRR